MANTTFNGPVRSENGFQEWDGSAWVPVAGGGGGGTTTIFTITNGAANTVTVPAPTAVGQQYAYASEIVSGASAGTTLEFTTAATPLYDVAVVNFIYSRANSGAVTTAGTGNPADIEDANFCYATFSYIGTVVSGGTTYGVFTGTLAA